MTFSSVLEMSSHSLACIVGLWLSAYALYVEMRKHRDPKYVAACDLSQHVSCSRVLTSEYSRGFGLVKYLVGDEHFLNVPNCLTGLVFYLVQLILGFLTMTWARNILFANSVIACMGSVYLAYILCFVLKDLCIICISTYIVNFYLLYSSYYKLN